LRHAHYISFSLNGAFWPTSFPLFHGTRIEVVELMVSMSCSFHAVLLVIGLLLALHHITGYIAGHTFGETMRDTAQKRALRNYRSRLAKRGIARFEVLGLDADRDLIRSVARRLAEEGADSARIRAAIGRTISGDPPKRGGILDALRRSPMVGADLEFERSRESGRKVDL
jgi:hypothetical protein